VVEAASGGRGAPNTRRKTWYREYEPNREGLELEFGDRDLIWGPP
jgi:hypothetical protein